MRKLTLILLAAAALGSPAIAADQAATHIRIWDGTVVPKHKCQTSPCVDCTFLDDKTCYGQADKLGLIDKQSFFYRADEPLESVCSRNNSSNLRHPREIGSALSGRLTPNQGQSARENGNQNLIQAHRQ